MDEITYLSVNYQVQISWVIKRIIIYLQKRMAIYQ